MAQNNFEKNIPYTPGQRISMDFTYPDLIKVNVWDKNEILITGQITINGGLDNGAFGIEVNNTASEISLTSILKDKDKIPQRITVNIKGETFIFQASGWDDPKVKEFLADKGKEGVQWMSNGMDIDIALIVTVPRNSELSIFSKFGMIELEDMPSVLEASSKHNGVDISVSPTQKLDFEINTSFGEVYTNLNLSIDKQNGLTPYKAQTLMAHLNGGGKKVYLESKFGNVYLRKKE